MNQKYELFVLKLQTFTSKEWNLWLINIETFEQKCFRLRFVEDTLFKQQKNQVGLDTRIKKTKSLIKLLVSELSERDVWATKTKIYKYMYFADFGSYALYKESMSGTPYLKFKFGPVPLQVDTLLDSMVENNELELQGRNGKNGSYQCYLFPSIFKNEYFTDRQIEVVTKTLNYFKDSTAKELSKETHYHYGWIAIKNGDTIPLESAEFVDFEWLGYSKDGKEAADFKELKETRDLFSGTPSLANLMRKVQNI